MPKLFEIAAATAALRNLAHFNDMPNTPDILAIGRGAIVTRLLASRANAAGDGAQNSPRCRAAASFPKFALPIDISSYLVRLSSSLPAFFSRLPQVLAATNAACTTIYCTEKLNAQFEASVIEPRQP